MIHRPLLAAALAALPLATPATAVLAADPGTGTTASLIQPGITVEIDLPELIEPFGPVFGPGGPTGTETGTCAGPACEPAQPCLGPACQPTSAEQPPVEIRLRLDPIEFCRDWSLLP